MANEMIISITGHRAAKIGGSQLPNPTYIKVCQKIEAVLKEHKPSKLITGMCTGVDQWGANICIKLGIPYISAIPFLGQEDLWPSDAKKIYRILLSKASEQHVVSEGGYSAAKFQIRNEWMVDNCDLLLGIFNGEPSGTANCINYAKRKNKKIIIINPNE